MITAYQQASANRLQSEAVMLGILAYVMPRYGWPKSMIDLGCGPGYMSYIASRLGVAVQGYDTDLPRSLWRGNLYLSQSDFLQLNIIPCDIALCLEVAEHINKSKVDILVGKIAQATGKCLVFSAATPGQGGSGHVNEQPHEYWIEKFNNAGLDLVEDLTYNLRVTLIACAPASWWYGKNVMCFEKR